MCAGLGGGGGERAGEAAHGGAPWESHGLSNMNQIALQRCDAMRSRRQARAPARRRVRRRGVSILDSILTIYLTLDSILTIYLTIDSILTII